MPIVVAHGCGENVEVKMMQSLRSSKMVHHLTNAGILDLAKQC